MKPIQAAVTLLVLTSAFELSNPNLTLAYAFGVRPAQKLERLPVQPVANSINTDNSLFDEAVKKQEQEDYPGAIATYTEFLKTHPERLDAYSNRGFAKAMMNDLKGALADFDRAIDLSPSQPDVYNARGNVHAMAGNLKASLHDFNVAIRLDRNFADAYYNRGISRHSLGDSNGAKSDISKAAQLFQTQKDIGGYQQAQEWIDKLK
jgi:tetratricopeptide (TPR) repeat protein